MHYVRTGVKSEISDVTRGARSSRTIRELFCDSAIVDWKKNKRTTFLKRQRLSFDRLFRSSGSFRIIVREKPTSNALTVDVERSRPDSEVTIKPTVKVV